MASRVAVPAAAASALADALPSAAMPAAGGDELARLLGLSGLLPVDVLSAILRVRAAVDSPGTLLVTGLPVDADLPPTPTGDAVGPGRAGPVSRGVLLLVAVLLGEPVAYRAEKDGALVQDVFPVRALASAPCNEGSSAPLGFHTELAFSRAAPDRPFHLTCPDFLLLLGLRCPPDRAAETVTVDARSVCARLGADDLATLRRPEFRLRAPHSFTRDGPDRPWSPPVPLVHGRPAAPSFAFDLACGVRPLTPEATVALDALRAVVDDPGVQTTTRLSRGDLLIVDNARCAHARRPFPARYDGHDRWLRRVYVRRSVWQLDHVPGTAEHVLA